MNWECLNCRFVVYSGNYVVPDACFVCGNKGQAPILPGIKTVRVEKKQDRDTVSKELASLVEEKDTQ